MRWAYEKWCTKRTFLDGQTCHCLLLIHHQHAPKSVFSPKEISASYADLSHNWSEHKMAQRLLEETCDRRHVKVACLCKTCKDEEDNRRKLVWVCYLSFLRSPWHLFRGMLYRCQISCFLFEGFADAWRRDVLMIRSRIGSVSQAISCVDLELISSIVSGRISFAIFPAGYVRAAVLDLSWGVVLDSFPDAWQC